MISCSGSAPPGRELEPLLALLAEAEGQARRIREDGSARRKRAGNENGGRLRRSPQAQAASVHAERGR